MQRPSIVFVYVIAAVASVAWLFTLVVAAVEHDWTGPTYTTPVMLPVVSFATGLHITRKRPPKDDRDPHA